MKELNSYRQIYFIGIGGIGMSAIARYFQKLSFNVSGYDKTPSSITDELKREGIDIHFEDLGTNILFKFKDKINTLIVYTPAIPNEFEELKILRDNNYEIVKRSQVLGMITSNSISIAVAGTHGKTTTSTLLTHILQQSDKKCSAFLGGISTNYNSNLIFSANSELTVIEADEFDRSFLQLNPFSSIITSTDPDHLDIYGDKSSFLEGFNMFSKLINENGLLMMKYGLNLNSYAKILTYSIEDKSDFIGENIRIINNKFYFDIKTPYGNWKDVELGLPGKHNAENALACIGMSLFLGLNESEIRKGLSNFKGVKRRFEYHIKTNELIYIDDYAHHPTEINALICSIKQIYPTLPIIGIFQPHLFSRTRDFLDAFAKELSSLDALILMPIYPAREKAIEGVNSEVLLDKCKNKTKNLAKNLDEINDLLKNYDRGVFLTIGAGDIDRIVNDIKKILEQKFN